MVFMRSMVFIFLSSLSTVLVCADFDDSDENIVFSDFQTVYDPRYMEITTIARDFVRREIIACGKEEIFERIKEARKEYLDFPLSELTILSVKRVFEATTTDPVVQRAIALAKMQKGHIGYLTNPSVDNTLSVLFYWARDVENIQRFFLTVEVHHRKAINDLLCDE